MVVYTAQVIGDIRGRWEGVTFTFMLAVQVVFAGDYLVRLLWARPRGVWFRAHLLDLAVVFVPILRPVRLLGALTRLTSFTRTAGSSVRAQLIITVVGRLAAVVRMAGGVVLVGLIVATISSWASERVAHAHDRRRVQPDDAVDLAHPDR